MESSVYFPSLILLLIQRPWSRLMTSTQSDQSLLYCLHEKKLRFLATHWARGEVSDQTEWIPRLIWVFAGRTVMLLFLSWGGSFVLIKAPLNHKLNFPSQTKCKATSANFFPDLFIYKTEEISLFEILPTPQCNYCLNQRNAFTWKCGFPQDPAKSRKISMSF